MPNVGYATLQVIPSVRGISSELRQQLVGPAGTAGDAAGDAAGSGFRDAFTGNLAALGVAEIGSKIGEQFTDAFAQAFEQADATKMLKAQLGASGKDAARYGKIAGELYTKGIVEDVGAGAEAVRATLSGGLVPPDATNKQLKSIAAQMSDVATTFGTDMSLQSQAVSAILKNGLAPSAEDALDVITTGFQKLGPNAEDLLETFQEYPVQLRKLGLDADTALGLFRQGLQGGARDTDIIADAFKEFSIRAIDMSQSSQDAYKLLGLDADKLSAQIALGGEHASGGLQLVLDRLRGMKDPVQQNAAAVGLFGTQAEDLGSALFKLDPSKATTAFGDVSGAAAQLGKDLHSGPTHEIEVFQRQFKQAFVDVIGGQVLPVLATAGRFLNTVILPPLSATASVAASALMPALYGLWDAGVATVGWLKDMGTWLIPIGIAVGGFTLALLAQQVATLGVTAAFGLYRGAILAWTGVQRAATIAQAAFNLVMNANPVILVITAIVALGAALVVAYQRSETFRAIVQGAWAGIQGAVQYAWNSVLKPTFAAIWGALQTVGQWATWLYQNAIKPAFDFIILAGRILATALVTIVALPVIAAFKLLAAIGTWLWQTALQPAFEGIAAAALWLWRSAISPVVGWVLTGFRWLWTGVSMVFGWFTAGLKTLGGWGVWLWRSAISPVVGWILTGFRWLWTGVSVVFGWFTTGLRTLGGWATWLYRVAVKPAFDAIGGAASWLWTHGLKPAFDSGKAGVALFGDAFEAAKDAIKIAWDKVREIARAPIAFVVNTVYSEGIVPVWNAVAKAFGAPTLEPKKFRQGGPVYGAGTETSDDVPAWLSKNEHVWTAKEVRGAGGHGAVMAMRKWAAAGGGSAATPGFADGGGLFGWIGKAKSKVSGWGSDAWNKVKKSASWLKDTLAGSARAGVEHVVKPLLRRIPGLDNGFGKMIARIPTKMIDALFGYADEADKKGASSSSFGGGKIPTGQHAAIIKAALSAAGVPPPGTLGQWLSGMNTLITRESNWNPRAINRWDSNARAGIPSQGLAQTIPPTWAAHVPASLRGRGILDPVGNVAAAIRYIVSRYGNITRVQQADASRPPAGYDSGGWLGPGDVGVNHLRKPEAVLTPSQSTAFVKLAAAAAAAPAGPVLAPAGASASTAPADGLRPGQAVYLQLEDGPLLRGWVRDIADTQVAAANSHMAMQASAGRRS
ncbi:phage tail tape measure protein [Streptomyces flaveolus]|uniref:phage tail tape measure protein n=1 Tax=Streptomyces flaveolus TaxID=67297 RepID=UPI0036F90A6B